MIVLSIEDLKARIRAYVHITLDDQEIEQEAELDVYFTHDRGYNGGTQESSVPEHVSIIHSTFVDIHGALDKELVKQLSEEALSYSILAYIKDKRADNDMERQLSNREGRCREC